MITFSKLEKKGHLGNQLFQIASTIGIAKSNNHEFGFPKWSYSSFFENELPFEDLKKIETLNEDKFHFTPKKIGEGSYDLNGWFQSEKYFDVELTKHYFKFRNTFINELKTKNEVIFSKKTLLISIRRGDFVDHPDYFQLAVNFYINALINNFHDWRERNLVIFSDDIDYCKFHFSFLKNVFFSDNLSAIEQLGMASMCDDFIISNSTFSWWCAWLGEKESSTIIRPLHYFTELKNEIHNDKDYFPDRWKVYNHLGVKINLKNTKVVIDASSSILEEYLSYYFHFEEMEARILPDFFNENLQNKETSFLFIRDVIIPPFCIYYAFSEQKKHVGILKGNYLKISKYLHYNLLRKQFDYGFFVKILKTKNTFKNSKEWLFVFIPEREKGFIIKNYKKNLSVNNGFIYLKTHAGKIKGFFELKYFYLINKKNLIISLKKTLKKLLK